MICTRGESVVHPSKTTSIYCTYIRFAVAADRAFRQVFLRARGVTEPAHLVLGKKWREREGASLCQTPQAGIQKISAGTTTIISTLKRSSVFSL